MGQIVSGYLDFAERQAERQKAMTMKDWATHLDNILTMSGEKLLQGAGKVSHQEAIDHATQEYKKYQQRTLSQVEKDYLDNIKSLPTNKRHLLLNFANIIRPFLIPHKQFMSRLQDRQIFRAGNDKI